MTDLAHSANRLSMLPVYLSSGVSRLVSSASDLDSLKVGEEFNGRDKFKGALVAVAGDESIAALAVGL